MSNQQKKLQQSSTSNSHPTARDQHPPINRQVQNKSQSSVVMHNNQYNGGDQQMQDAGDHQVQTGGGNTRALDNHSDALNQLQQENRKLIVNYNAMKERINQLERDLTEARGQNASHSEQLNTCVFELQKIKNELTVVKLDKSKLESELSEIKRRQFLTVVVPVVFDHPDVNLDPIIQGLNDAGHKDFIKLKRAGIDELESMPSKSVLYFVNVSTPRLQQQYNEEKLKTVKSHKNALLCVIRYGTNAESFPEFFEDPMATGQFIWNGVVMLDCNSNRKNIDRVLGQIRQQNPHPENPNIV